MASNVLLAALKHVWTTLAPLRLPMAVMGGVALAVWQYVRATRDVDLLLSLGNTDPGLVMARLAAANIHPKRQPPLVPLGSLQVAQLSYEPAGAFVDVQVDLLLAGSDYHRQALTRRVPVHLPDLGMEIHVLGCEDLILHKLLAGRMIDRADAAALLRLNRGSLDLGYLHKEVAALGLRAEFGEAWRQAFPEEPVPKIE
jgi:hypothetical protein